MYEQMVRGEREGPIGRRIVAVAVVSVVAVILITALAVALTPPRPPGSILTGTSWQWTGTTSSADEGPRVVSDPATYAIEFNTDRTFQAQADCNAVTGTYRRILPGRTGTSWTGLTLSPAATSLVACGPDSLSDVYLRDLETAARYVIADGRLTIALSDGRAMTFRAAAPAASRPLGA
jgi:heat shock protein HslJ